MKYRLILVVAAGLLIVGCGSSTSSVTLHGTFTDYQPNSGSGPNPATCSYELNPQNGASNVLPYLPNGPYRITVAEDNVLAGSVPVHWQDNGNVAPKFIPQSDTYPNPLDVCTGTWTMTLQLPAHTAYEIGVSGLDGTVAVAVANSGETIAVNDEGPWTDLGLDQGPTVSGGSSMSGL